jgi:hypothetical protein
MNTGALTARKKSRLYTPSGRYPPQPNTQIGPDGVQIYNALDAPAIGVETERTLEGMNMVKRLIQWLKNSSGQKRGNDLLEESDVPVELPAIVPQTRDAAELLHKVNQCSEKNDEWAQIWERVDPPYFGTQFQDLFTQLRGRHLAAPHVGIYLMRHGAKKLLLINPRATAEDVLRVALRANLPSTRR